jgi:hypothetical protein
LEAEVMKDRADEGPNGTGIVNDQGQHPATVVVWGWGCDVVVVWS